VAKSAFRCENQYRLDEFWTKVAQAVRVKGLCVVQGAAAGKYAGQLLKASFASYAKGLAPPALCTDFD
jgi:hypothetical protein